jgi:acetyl-CoA carboxylase biotin carboxyl carrier protein
VPGAFEREKWEMAVKKVVTDVAGNVWKIVTKVGDRLAEDDTIMIMESMKMEIPVVAPSDGVLKELLVAEGESIAEGEIVAIIE